LKEKEVVPEAHSVYFQVHGHNPKSRMDICIRKKNRLIGKYAEKYDLDMQILSFWFDSDDIGWTDTQESLDLEDIHCIHGPLYDGPKTLVICITNL
jgi:hypothetical protein